MVRHSFDINDPRPSITASDAVVNGVGLCHAKAHLLVALLRSRNIHSLVTLVTLVPLPCLLDIFLRTSNDERMDAGDPFRHARESLMT